MDANDQTRRTGRHTPRRRLGSARRTKTLSPGMIQALESLRKLQPVLPPTPMTSQPAALPPTQDLGAMFSQVLADIFAEVVRRAWQKYSPINFEITKSFAAYAASPGLSPEERENAQKLTLGSSLYGFYHICDGISKTLEDHNRRVR